MVASPTSSMPSAGAIRARVVGRYLRGKAMEDVIFAGSDRRGPLGYCEVFADVRKRRPASRRVPVGSLEITSPAPVPRRHERVLSQQDPVPPARHHRVLHGHRYRHPRLLDHRAGRVGMIVSSKPEERRHRRGGRHHQIQAAGARRRRRSWSRRGRTLAAGLRTWWRSRAPACEPRARRKRPSATSATGSGAARHRAVGLQPKWPGLLSESRVFEEFVAAAATELAAAGELCA